MSQSEPYYHLFGGEDEDISSENSVGGLAPLKVRIETATGL
jgi:hypothetical protein